MKKYNILILSNLKNIALVDDTFVKSSFETDGHNVDLKEVGYDESLDGDYDVIIRRNTWVSKEAETASLYEKNNNLINRLKRKNIKTVNMVGLDGIGKGYLCVLFDANENVIPTINTLNKLELIPETEKYIVKDIKSFGNGLHQRLISSENLKDNYEEGNIIQPVMSFKSEVQCYYVADRLMYVFEYTPSKYPNYPEPNLIELSQTEKTISDKFAKYSNLKHGFQRIDFLRLMDDSLILMEIEDHAAFMNLQRLSADLREKVLAEYKKNIYALLG